MRYRRAEGKTNLGMVALAIKAAVIRGGKVTYAKGFGLRDPKK